MRKASTMHKKAMDFASRADAARVAKDHVVAMD